MEHVSHFFLSIVEHAGYPGLFFVMVVGNLGIPAGLELVVPAAGALAATGHFSSVYLVAAVALAGDVTGQLILYGVGFVGGRPFVVRYGRYLKLDEKKLDTFHTFYQRYGSIVVFVCRFLPFVRGVSGLPAGVSRMPKRYFVAYTAAGSGVFCFGLAYAGSMFGSHFDEIAPLIHKASTALVLVILLAIVLFVADRIVRARRKANQPL